jgi:hypothetical protein
MNGTWASWPRPSIPPPCPARCAAISSASPGTGASTTATSTRPLDLPLKEGLPQTLRDFDLPTLAARQIHLGDHCYGCTAGAGSSCGGKLVGE